MLCINPTPSRFMAKALVGGYWVEPGTRFICDYNDNHRVATVEAIRSTADNLGINLTCQTINGYRTFNVNKIRNFRVY